MARITFAFMVFLLVGLTDVRADGSKFAPTGWPVPEREQRAMIEWSNGVETLHVAVLTDADAEGSVWVVPVRAAASVVRAEPVDRFPTVAFYERLYERAEKDLRGAIMAAGLLNSGGLLCPLYCGGFGCSSDGQANAVEESRVERYGMIVTVVSAYNRAELERYLVAQGVNLAVADLSSLDPYVGQTGYSFVCGWVAKGEPITATGLRLVFPSPTLWFPLKATRAYKDPIETVVYVRGFVKPAVGCDLLGLRCDYVYGVPDLRKLPSVFANDRRNDRRSYYHEGTRERFTRVTLTTDPQQWNCDLELVPGVTPSGSVALAITEWTGWFGVLCFALLGAVLGALIPFAIIAKAERDWTDWVVGAFIGACITLSIAASFVVFRLWSVRRFAGEPRDRRRYLVLPALAVVHFGIVWIVCQGLILWIGADG